MTVRNVSSPAFNVGGLVNSIAAAGSTQGTATEINGSWNVVTTATATTQDGVRMPDDYPLHVPLWIINATNVALDVFPQTGGQINGLSANAAKALAANMAGLYIQYENGKWGAVLSA